MRGTWRCDGCVSWWSHQIETFSASLALFTGNSPVTGEFPAQPVTWSFGVFFDLRQNKRSSKQPRGWWFETPSCSLWRHCNGFTFQTAHHQTVKHVTLLEDARRAWLVSSSSLEHVVRISNRIIILNSGLWFFSPKLYKYDGAHDSFYA